MSFAVYDEAGQKIDNVDAAVPAGGVAANLGLPGIQEVVLAEYDLSTQQRAPDSMRKSGASTLEAGKSYIIVNRVPRTGSAVSASPATTPPPSAAAVSVVSTASAAEAVSTDVPLLPCCGWLQKKGEVNTNFQRRFFVLEKGGSSVGYYKEQSDHARAWPYNAPFGRVTLLQGRSARLSSDKLTFEVPAAERQFVLRADKPEDAARWVAAINYVASNLPRI